MDEPELQVAALLTVGHFALDVVVTDRAANTGNERQRIVPYRTGCRSQLARATKIAPAIITRWMQGTRPAVDSLAKGADALGLNPYSLLQAAGYIEVDPFSEDDPRRAALIAKVRLIDLSDERYALLENLLESMRRRRIAVEDR